MYNVDQALLLKFIVICIRFCTLYAIFSVSSQRRCNFCNIFMFFAVFPLVFNCFLKITPKKSDPAARPQR